MSLRGLFVTGTDTGVGKTWIACNIVKALVADGRKAGAMKPIATSAVFEPDGSLVSPDSRALQDAIGGNVEVHRINPIVYEGDMAPSAAMRKAGRTEDWASLSATIQDAVEWWADRCDILIVEGIGGWLCPIAEDATVADLAGALDYPVVVVARPGLGTLNHTLLTVESIRGRGVRVAGVVLNRRDPGAVTEADATNPGELSRRLGPIPILGIARHSESDRTLSTVMADVDWWDRAAGSRRVAAELS